MRFRTHAKALFIAFVLAAVVDLCSMYFSFLLTQTQRFNESVSYGLSSVSLSSVFKVFFGRLQIDRYHPSVLSVRTPFNLSEACRQREPTSLVQELCRNPGSSSMSDSRPWHDFSETFQQSVFGPGPLVDEQKYPRSKLEYVMGLPDAALHSFVCAWRGRDACGVPAFPGAEVRSNWFGKFVLLLTMFLTVGATIVEITEAKSTFLKANRVAFGVVVLPIRFLFALLIVGIASLVALLILKLLTALGLLLSGVLLSMAAFLPAKWLLDAIKDFVADKIKKPIVGED